MCGDKGILLRVVIPACHFKYLIGNEVFAGSVALDDGCHHVLGDVGVVGEELLGVFGEAIAAVTEGGIIVVGSDTWVKTDALDYCLGVESFVAISKCGS